jgi:DNA-directed RNA polymerase subunit RPC12/RpoP
MKKESDENIYLKENIIIKKIIYVVLASIDLFGFIFSGFMFLGMLLDYTPAFGFGLFGFISFGILLYLRGRSLVYVEVAEYYSKIFARKDGAFLDVYELPEFNNPNGVSIYLKSDFKKNVLKLIEGALKKGYLKNCTIEIHNGKPKVVLDKKIVKDTCPNCGAPIVGAKNEIYVCSYCGSKISGVVKKS